MEEKPLTIRQAAGDAIRKLFPGLSLTKMREDIGRELKHLAALGAQELANVLYHGSAFVLYPRDQDQQKLTLEQIKAEPIQERPHEHDHQRERGGRE
jgi:hypothetical protein